MVSNIDDILIYGSTIEEHKRIRNYLGGVRKVNVNFNKEKFQQTSNLNGFGKITVHRISH